MLEELAKEIAHSKNKLHILEEIKWYLNGHYEKSRFLALLMVNGIYKQEYDKIIEKLANRDMLMKLYILILKNMNE
jgi:hypothetical protein